VHAHSSGATFAELSGALEQFSLDIFTPLIGGNKLFHTYGIEANGCLQPKVGLLYIHGMENLTFIYVCASSA